MDSSAPQRGPLHETTMETEAPRNGPCSFWLDDVLSSPADESGNGEVSSRAGAPIYGALVGSLTGFDDAGRALVDFSGNTKPHPVPAARTVPLSAADVGRPIVLMFEGGQPDKPILLGVVEDGKSVSRASDHADTPRVEAELDGERLVLTAEKEIVLRCGKASITLTKAGKILIRGAYLLSRSSGVNRVKGGSVQIN